MRTNNSAFVLLEALVALFLIAFLAITAMDGVVHVVTVLSKQRQLLTKKVRNIVVFDAVLRDLWSADPSPSSWTETSFVKKLYDRSDRPCLAKVKYEQRKDGFFRWEQRYSFQAQRWLQPTAVNLGRGIGPIKIVPHLKNHRVVAAALVFDSTLSITVRLRNTYVTT